MGPSVTTPPCSKVRKLSLREAKSLTQAHTAGTRTHKSQHLSVRLAKCPPLTLQKVKVKLFSCVQLFATSRTVAYQPPSSMGFSRQEYWRGVPWIIWQLYFQFLKEPLLASPIYIPINCVKGFPSLHSVSNIYCLWVFRYWPF